MAPTPKLETILIERLSEGAVLLSYNTPQRSNAFTPQQYDDLREGLVWARDDPAVRVIVVFVLSCPDNYIMQKLISGQSRKRQTLLCRYGRKQNYLPQDTEYPTQDAPWAAQKTP
jgi:1,4-dihydroxy-2-naphthoyl-CoA synthase